MKVERTSRPGWHVVYGEQEADYGRQHYGWVDGVGGRFQALGCDAREEGGRKPLGEFPTLSKAARAVVSWAAENLTAAALQAEFEPRTAGGSPVRFLRRAGDSIVATVEDTRTGRRMTTSWNEDGACELYADDIRGSERHALGEALRLVRRERAHETSAGTEIAPAP